MGIEVENEQNNILKNKTLTLGYFATSCLN